MACGLPVEFLAFLNDALVVSRNFGCGSSISFLLLFVGSPQVVVEVFGFTLRGFELLLLA